MSNSKILELYKTYPLDYRKRLLVEITVQNSLDITEYCEKYNTLTSEYVNKEYEKQLKKKKDNSVE